MAPTHDSPALAFSDEPARDDCVAVSTGAASTAGDSPGRTGHADSVAATAPRRIRVNGIDLNVVIAGEGPDVLLVHGFPDSWEVWRRQIPALVEAGYRVIAPDMRGCGDSEIPPAVGDYRIGNLVADLVALLDALGIASVKLVAHDWGAVIGWHLAIEHPERVERYVALSVGHPAAYAAFDLRQRLMGWYVLFFQLRDLAEWILTRHGWAVFRRIIRFDAEFPRWRERLSRPGRLTAGLSYYRANLHLLRSRGVAQPVAVPVDAFWSSGDRFLAEKQMLESQRHVRAGWTYTRIDGAGHWLQIDAADRFTPMLLDRLRQGEEKSR